MATKKEEKPPPKLDAGEAFVKFLQGALNTVLVSATAERAATAETAAKLLFEELLAAHAAQPGIVAERRAHYEKTFPFLKPNPLRDAAAAGFTNPPAPFDFDAWLKRTQGGGGEK